MHGQFVRLIRPLSFRAAAGVGARNLRTGIALWDEKTARPLAQIPHSHIDRVELTFVACSFGTTNAAITLRGVLSFRAAAGVGARNLRTGIALWDGAEITQRDPFS